MSDFQKLSIVGPGEFDSNGNLTVVVKYESSDSTTTGIGFGVHYDSTSMTLTGVSQDIANDAVASITTAPSDASDPSMVMHAAGYASLFGNWPGTTEADLYTLTFTQVEGGPGNTGVYLSYSSSHAGYDEINDNPIPEPPLEITVNPIAENSGENQVIAKVANGTEGATYSLVDNTNYGGGDDGVAQAPITAPEAGTNVQNVYVSQSTLSDDGSQVTLVISYLTDSSTLTGVGFSVDFDSNLLALNNVELLHQGDNIAAGNPSDANGTTSLAFGYASLFGNFPGSTAVDLATVTLDVNGSGPAAIGISSVSSHAGYDLVGQGHTVQLPAISPLSIDSATGDVTLTVNPDYESVPVYSFDVVADGGARSGSANAGITNVDEVAPVFQETSVTLDITENSGAGQLIHTAEADDSADASAGLEYSLSGADAAAFSIDSATGAVTLTADPDYETQSSYSFTVVASDGVNAASEQSVSLAINNVDDTAPVFTSGGIATSAVDNGGAGQWVYSAIVDDSADTSAGGITYSLSGDDADAFSIDETSGVVTLTANPDYETQPSYSFNVVATDAMTNSSTQSVTLAVDNVDDTAPTITSGSVATSIAENSGARQVVYTASADDSSDVNDGVVTYSLAGADADAFTIDPASGAVSLDANPDFESQEQYSFEVVATDAANNASSAQSVTLDIINELDSKPSWLSADDAGSINENAGAGAVVYTASAEVNLEGDADGAEGVGLSYAFGASTADLDSGPNDTWVHSVTLTTAADGSASQGAQTIVVNVTDLPEDGASYRVVKSVANGNWFNANAQDLVLGENVITVGGVSFDRAVKIQINSSEVSYDSLEINGDSVLPGPFIIDAASGDVTLTDDPDHETVSSYSFSVVATDDLGNASAPLGVSLAVNDLDEVAATVTSGDTAAAIDENDGPQVIYTATADDSGDTSGGVTFSLTDDSDPALSIDSATGEVSIDGEADHEVQAVYNFAVVATDAADNASDPQSVTLNINDLDDAAPTIDSGDSADSVDENSNSGQVVYSATADDSGDDVADGPITFTLTSDSDSEFSIDESTGAVSFDAVADHESKDEYSFAVVATDAAGNASEAETVTMSVNDLDDAAPTITSGNSAGAIDENSGAGQIIYTATADDSGDDVADGPVTFSLAVGSDAALSIDTASGDVSIDADPDHETQPHYSFAVIATDAAGNASAAQSVTLDIHDLDEAAPLIYAPAVDKTLPAFSDAGQTVYSPAGYSDDLPTVEAAYDDRSDVTSEPLRFAISFDADNQQYADAFSINADTGEVTYDEVPATELDSLTIPYTVTVTDASGLSSSVDLNLVISGNEEDRPLFNMPTEQGDTVAVGFEQTGSELVDQTASGQLEQLESVRSVRGDISEDFAQGDVVIYQASVSDVSQVKYTLANENADLAIDENTGEVTLVSGADFDSIEQYDFTVVATDTSGNVSSQDVTLDVREAYLSVGENTAANQVVYIAETGDSSDTFRLADGHHEALAINSTTGEVFLLESPDFEATQEYAFVVEAVNGDEVSEYPVYVSVNNVDDTAPEVTSGDVASAINENSGSDQVIYTATADDSLDSSGTVTFSLADGSDAALRIEGADVILGDNPDHEAQSEYSFTVVASDGTNSSEQSVTLQINDLDEIDPRITSSNSAEITENNPANQVIYTASGHDATSVIEQGAIRQEFVHNADDTLTVKFFVDASAGVNDLETVQFTFNYESDKAGILSAASDASIEYPSNPFAGVANTESYGQINFALLFTPDEISGIGDKGLYDVDGDIAIAEVTFDVGSHDAMSTFTVSEVGVLESGADNSTYLRGQSVSEYAMNDGGLTTFEISDASDSALSIDANTGEVLLEGSADYEAAQDYTFTVIASDASGNSTQQNVTVSVNNLDEVAPTIDSGDSADAIDENSGAAQVIYTATADDSADTSDGFSFSLAEGSDEALSIDAASGEVTLATDPDHEAQSSYSFTVVATDAAGHSSEQSVTLDINDLDDTADVITSGDTANAIDENSGADQVIYTVTSEDLVDDSSDVQYSLADGSDAALSINATTGEVSLSSDPDHEAQAEYSFAVIATDGAGNVSEAQSVTLNINDLDDTKPEITSAATTLNVDENSGAGQVVYTATADDSFDVSNGVTFAIENNHSAISINPVTGEVTLSVNPDHETQGSYNFDVIAKDADGNSSTQNIELEINDLDEVAPTITSGASAGRIDENTEAGQVIYTATATDSDDISGGFTFSLTRDSAPGLEIDAETGVVTLVKTPDYESRDEYAFTVVATDAAGNASDQAVTLNIDPVTDVRVLHWGSDIRVSGVKIKQGADEIGTTDAIGDKQVARDYREGDFAVERDVELADTQGIVDTADALAAMKMAVRAEVAAPDTDNAYEYDQSLDFDGDNVVTDVDLLKMAADFNGDGKVSSRDALEILKFAAGMSDAQLPGWMFAKNDSEQVDNDDSPEDSASYTALIKGDINANWVSSRDEQEVVKQGETFADDVVYRFDPANFAFREVEGSEGIFAENSGVVTANNSEAGKFSYAIVNLETGAERTITVKLEAADSSGPVFESASLVSVASGVEAGDVVYTAVATDDSKLVKYDFGLEMQVDDNGDETGVELPILRLGDLSINGRTGDVTLDNDTHESDAALTFTVFARDLDSNDTSHTVTLSVNAIPDTEAPDIRGDSVVSIVENTDDNVVYTPNATDSYGSEITYSLGRGSDPALSIENGLVVLNENADSEGQSAYKFILVATDSAGNSTAQKIVVNVNDADEVAPTITSGDVVDAIDENSGEGQVVYTVTTDDSKDTSGGVTLSLSGDDAAAFSINSDGEVALTANPDHEAQNSYSFTVVATDDADNASEQALTLEINDLDEVAPTITSADAAVSIDENSGAGQVVYTATATDSGDTSDGVLFSLSGDDAGAFSIDKVSGEVTLAANPDYEGQSSYSFTVEASDGAEHVTSQSVSLEINNLDEVAPGVILSGVDSIDENSGEGQVIASVIADDAQDTSAGMTLKLGGDDAAAFELSNGEITLIANPNNEEQSSYNFSVIATDAAGNSSEEKHSFEINDIDEMAPVFTSGASGSIVENSGSGQVIYDANATDSLDISGGLSYSIITDAPDNSFTPEAGAGNVQTVFVEGSPIANAGEQVEVKVDYFADDNLLSGLGIRIHFNSSVLSVDEITNVFQHDLIYTNAVAESDDSNLDGIASTDSYVTAGWASLDGDWTATGLPEDLLTVVFDVAGNASGSTEIGFSAISTPVGWGLYGVDHDLYISDFNIDESNGDVTLTANPDFESQSSYNFTVVATDAAGFTAEQDVTIAVENVDEVAASITSGNSAANIDENSGRSQLVYTVQSDDSADVSQGAVTYSLVDNDPAIAINSKTGDVFLLANPDHENQSEYSFTVVSTDAAGHVSDSETVTLTINDLDDTSPVIASASTVASINENSGAGQVIYTAVADDSADVNDGSMTYSLSEGHDEALSIDSVSGEVTLSADPDHEDQSEYDFTVIASDGINPSVEQTLKLTINNLDDTAPFEVTGAGVDAIDENSGAGQLVYTASADDSLDMSDGISFSLTANSDSALSINADNGEVTLATDPDNEAQSQYSFTVVATDAAGNATEGQAVTLDINDLDDAAPTITSASIIAAVEAGSSAGEVVYTATADDSGDDVSDGVTFSLSGDDAGAFSIDGDTGAVTLVNGASAEGHSFSVVATDEADNVSSSQDVSMAVYQPVSGQQPQGGSGDINQTFTHNADGSVTLHLTVNTELNEQFSEGLTNLDFDLSFDPAHIAGGSIKPADISSPATLIMVNDDVPGTLTVAQVYFNGLDLQAGDSIMDVTFSLSANSASFNVENVLMNDDVAMSGSISSVGIESHSGTAGDDVFMLDGVYTNVESDGSDTFIVTDQVDTSVVIDFESESDKIEMTMLLDAAGYSEDNAATQVSGDTLDLADLISGNDSSLDNTFGGSFDSETNVLELFVDTDSSDGVSMESYEVTLSEGSDFDDDDLSVNFAAFIA